AVTPVALRIIREAASLYLQQTAEQYDSFTDPSALARFWRLKIGSLSHEVFQVGYLDTTYHLLRDGVETLEEATIDRAAVYPRRVIEAALRRGAATLVFAHNHPNGNVLYAGGMNEYEDPDQPFPKGHVQVMTIHQAKGLEFPVVVVGSLDKQLSTTR